MDKALAHGDIAVTLPYIKKKGMEVLKADYQTREELASQITLFLLSSAFINKTTRTFTPHVLKTLRELAKRFLQSPESQYLS